MGHSEGLPLPSDTPLMIVGACAIAFWGISLLFAAMPSLMCIPTMPRSLRLGSMGIRISAASIGLMYGPNVPIVATLFSGGMILAYCVELLLSAWLSRLPSEDTYSKISLDDNDDSDLQGVELTSQSNQNDTSRDDLPPTNTAPVISPIARGLAAAATALYFAFVRGLQLGADIHVLGGQSLEIDLVCTLGQIALFAAALSVALQDTKGLDLTTNAAVVMSYACTTPIGIIIGGLTTTYNSELGYRSGAPEKGLVGFGYTLGYFSCAMGGAMLYQTFASTLPREVNDANAEWNHKFSAAASSKQNKPSDTTFLCLQLSRIVALLTGWCLMALFHWPELARGFMGDE